MVEEGWVRRRVPHALLDVDEARGGEDARQALDLPGREPRVLGHEVLVHRGQALRLGPGPARDDVRSLDVRLSPLQVPTGFCVTNEEWLVVVAGVRELLSRRCTVGNTC